MPSPKSWVQACPLALLNILSLCAFVKSHRRATRRRCRQLCIPLRARVPMAAAIRCDDTSCHCSLCAADPFASNATSTASWLFGSPLTRSLLTSPPSYFLPRMAAWATGAASQAPRRSTASAQEPPSTPRDRLSFERAFRTGGSTGEMASLPSTCTQTQVQPQHPLTRFTPGNRPTSHATRSQVHAKRSRL